MNENPVYCEGFDLGENDAETVSYADFCKIERTGSIDGTVIGPHIRRAAQRRGGEQFIQGWIDGLLAWTPDGDKENSLAFGGE